MLAALDTTGYLAHNGTNTNNPNDWCGFFQLLPYVEQDNLYQKLDLTQREYANCNGPNSPGATVVNTYICPTDNLPANKVSTFVSGGTTYYFGMNSYLGNGGTCSWFESYGTLHTDGMFYLNSAVTMAGVTDGTSNTLFFGERLHWDPNWTNIQTLGGWAWSNYLSGQDVLGSSLVPVNFLVPAGQGSNQSTTDKRVNAFGSRHTNGVNFALVDGSVRFITASSTSSLPVLQALSTRAGGEVQAAP